MDPTNQRKPFLPRLMTSIPLIHQGSSAILTFHPKSRDDSKGKPLRPEAPPFLPENQRENIAPGLYYPPNTKPVCVALKAMEDPPVSKKKSMYYEDAFTTRGAHNSPQDRVASDAVVIAELKTNIKVCDTPMRLSSCRAFCG